MHRSVNALVILSAINMFGIGIGYAADNGGSTRTQVYEKKTEQYVDDGTITTRIKAKQAVDDVVKATSVYVETYKGIVQLAGFVKTDAEKTRAEDIAKEIKGVREVRNNIIVMP